MHEFPISAHIYYKPFEKKKKTEVSEKEKPLGQIVTPTSMINTPAATPGKKSSARKCQGLKMDGGWRGGGGLDIDWCTPSALGTNSFCLHALRLP